MGRVEVGRTKEKTLNTCVGQMVGLDVCFLLSSSMKMEVLPCFLLCASERCDTWKLSDLTNGLGAQVGYTEKGTELTRTVWYVNLVGKLDPV